MILQVCSTYISEGRLSNRGSSKSSGMVVIQSPFLEQLEEIELTSYVSSAKSCPCGVSCEELHLPSSIQSAIDGLYYCWFCLPENQPTYQLDD